MRSESSGGYGSKSRSESMSEIRIKKKISPVHVVLIILALGLAGFGGWKWYNYRVEKKADNAEYQNACLKVRFTAAFEEAEKLAGTELRAVSDAADSGKRPENGIADDAGMSEGEVFECLLADGDGIPVVRMRIPMYKQSRFDENWKMFGEAELAGLLEQEFFLQSDMELLVDRDPSDGIDAKDALPELSKGSLAGASASSDAALFADDYGLDYYKVSGLFRYDQTFIRLSSGEVFNASGSEEEKYGLKKTAVLGGAYCYHPQISEELIKVMRSSYSEKLVRQLDLEKIKVKSLNIRGPVQSGYYSAEMLVEAELEGSGNTQKKYRAVVGYALGADGAWWIPHENEYEEALPAAVMELIKTASLSEEPVFEIPKPAPKQSPYYIKVNRLQNCVTIYGLDSDGGYSVPVKAMVCSTGREGHKTPLGDFAVMDFKARWCYMIDGSYGQYATGFRSGGYLFHSICYTAKEQDAMMTYEYNMLGDFASLGCVRLQTVDAKWIFDNCPVGTGVSVYESEDPGPLGKPVKAVEEITEDMDNGWDPTDPAEGNPWRD